MSSMSHHGAIFKPNAGTTFLPSTPGLAPILDDSNLVSSNRISCSSISEVLPTLHLVLSHGGDKLYLDYTPSCSMPRGGESHHEMAH